MPNILQETFNKHKMLALKKNNISEIFTIDKKTQFKNDLKIFLRNQFQKHNLGSEHMGPSATEYKVEDWIDTMAETMVNNFAGYLEKIRGQTEKDLDPEHPIVRDEQ